MDKQTASRDVIDVLDTSSLANNFTTAPLVLTPNRGPYGNVSVMEPITLTEPRYAATAVVLEDKVRWSEPWSVLYIVGRGHCFVFQAFEHGVEGRKNQREVV
mgnify:CR=1 FL=1